MKTSTWPLLIAGGAVVAGIVKLYAKDRRPMAVAPSIDLSRYTGRWCEIARLPNRFQKSAPATPRYLRSPARWKARRPQSV